MRKGPLPRSPFAERMNDRQIVIGSNLFEQQIGQRRGGFADDKAGEDLLLHDEQLETFSGMSARWRDVFDNGIEQRFHGAARVLQIHFGETFLGAGVNHGKIHLLVRRVQ